MKELLIKNASLLLVVAVVIVTAFMPELALAQAGDNPFISGLKNASVIKIAQVVMYAAAFLLFASEGILALKDGNLANILKVGLGVAILVAAAIKLKEILGMFE